MIFIELSHFSAQIAESPILLALDMGEKRIGIACSVASIATPLATYQRRTKRQDLGYIAALAMEKKAAGFIIGLPLQLNGLESEFCINIRAFASKLAEKTALPILFWDERMSTAAVTRAMKNADISRKARHEKDDALAACYILQAALDSFYHARAIR
jgi:putative Holliday junction resolvase